MVQAGILQGSLYEPANITLVHHANQALRAHKLFQKDKDYIVKNGEVMLIDEFTGRMMQGRRLSEGLHQAIEAKEKTKIQPENQTLASITFQNYFRLYDKLAGMTGTASTEAAEFQDIYKLEVTEVPTNRPVKRIDEDDVVYRTAKEKYKAIIADIRDCVRRKQPVLVGTVSIEKSEVLSNLLSAEKIPHQVLNARHHEREAHIIAQAGVPGAVTVATNMAGRGTDIQLGGNVEMRVADEGEEKAKELGRELTEDELEGAARARSRPTSPPRRPRRWPPAVSTCWPPSATKAAASTTSCAAVPAARATRAARNSTSASRTTCCASSPPNASTPSCAALASRKTRPSPTSG